MKKVTARAIDYRSAPYGHIADIPEGTPVVPADNLPNGGYWVQPWAGMGKRAESWQRSYGFLVEENDVVEEKDYTVSKYKHLVMVEIPAYMSDDGEVLIEERTVQAELDGLQPVKEWCDDDSPYVLRSSQLQQPLTTTCGVIRKIMENRK